MSILASRHSDKEVRSRTSGFQSETSDHEDKAIHPRRTGDWRIPSPYEASTRMFHHVHPCARVACACVYVCGWHCLNLEAWRSRLCFGVKRPRSKRKKDWPPGCSRVLLCELDANLSNGRRSPRSRNRFDDRPWTSHPQGDKEIFCDGTGAGFPWTRHCKGCSRVELMESAIAEIERIDRLCTPMNRFDSSLD